MTVPTLMTGFDRTYLPPRSVRRAAAADSQADALTARLASGRCTAWDLLELERREASADWARHTLDSVLASMESEGQDALGCVECEDTGFYGVPDAADQDLLTGLVRRGDGEVFEALAADGSWQVADEPAGALEVLSLDQAADLALAITAGACGLLRRYTWPRAFLPPSAVTAATTLRDVVDPAAPATPQGEWVNYAVVDEADPGAVFDLIRVGIPGPEVQRWDAGTWVPDPDLADDLPLMALSADQHTALLDQLHPDALVADAPLTVSPDPRAERLRRYWSTGKGAAKIRWGTPGDFGRCYRQVRKYMGVRAKGWCQNMHKRNTGVWTGDRRNVGVRGDAALLAPEESLLASVRSGQWGRTTGRTTDMPEQLVDGTYAETEEQNVGVLRTLVSSGFPVAPPDEWFENPQLTGPTPLEIDDDGRVHGHIATFDVVHIGMAGATRAPRSRSGYAYFNTGALRTASGRDVSVGQLTLVGGHAGLDADLESTVKHYDDTRSGVADVHAGEDRYGVWVAGALRPSVTPEQVRVMRATPPSGDWRPVNGGLELVAACHVNVQGFPIARARVASGAIVALVAAGARPLALLKASMTADGAVLERLAHLESRLDEIQPGAVEVLPVEPAAAPVEAAEPEPVADAVVEEIIEAEVIEEQPVAAAVDTAEAPPAEAEAEEPVAEPTAEEIAAAERISLARAEVAALQRQVLRDRVHGSDAGAEAQTAAGAVTIKGTDSFPISDVASLKKAIQAFGRAKDKVAAKKHIQSMAFKLKRPDLIPANWKEGK